MADYGINPSTDSNEAFITFLIYCLVVVTVVLFFLFYVNRVFAQTLSKLINIYTWKKYRAYFEIDALQFSLLGGRILFKNFRYYSRNQSIFILQGHITFRYWFLRVREEKNGEVSNESNTSDNPATQERCEAKEPPCRIKCEIKGLEWFIYNRTPVYDIMEEIINPSNRESSVSQGFNCNNSQENITVNFDGDIPPADTKCSLFRKMLPIQFDCDIGSITIGNNDLPTILISSFSQATGVYSAAKSSSPLDYYKSVLNMDIISPKISCRINVDYNDKVGRTDSEQAELLAQEYARVSTIVECSELYFNYYADVPGPVPYQSRLELDPSEIDIGNGGPPPQYGIHLIFKQGIIHYGPWTDQQRSSMQNYFFPNSYRDLEKTTSLQHGSPRMHTELKMFIQLDKDVTIRVPFREPSKNWKYLTANNGAYYGARNPRPYGWIDFKSSGFYIDLSVPLVVGENGYATMVDVRCQDLELATSTNYAAMLHSQSFHIHCVLQNPLIWNQIRTWVFDLNFEKTKLYLLRDQITLLQDMIKDWTTGSSVDFIHFVPIEYIYKMIFDGLEINLYVNEHNIINDPSDLDDNSILTLSMSRLDAAVITPFGKFEPKTNNIEFSINMQKNSLSLSLPTSHTASAFLPKRTQNIGTIKGFVIDGNYEYYTKVDPTHLDTLTMNAKLTKPNLQLSGLFVKHLMIVKDNYLGAFNNFLTFEEYRSRIDSSFDRIEQVNAQYRAKNPENPYEVFIRLLLEDAVFKLPENLYACEDFLELYIQELQIENRSTDFYQDLYTTTTPVFLTKGGSGVPTFSKQKIPRIHKDRQDTLYIEDITIHAHRMFGPLPHTNTYICDWKLDFGSVLGRVGPNFLAGFNSFLDSFIFNYVDRENTFPSEFQIPSFPDLTLLKVGITDLDFMVWAGGSVSQLLVNDGIQIDFNNLINEIYNSKAYVSIPDLVLRFMTISENQNGQMYSGLDNEEISWVEVASIETALNISIYTNTPDWKERRQKQLSYIRHEDRETLRCCFVYEDDTNTIYETSSTKAASDNHLNGSYLPPLTSTILEGYNEPLMGAGFNTSANDLSTFFSGSQNILLDEDTKSFWPVCDSPTEMNAKYDFEEIQHTPSRQNKTNGYFETLSLNYSGSSRAGSMLSHWDGTNNDRVSSYYTNGADSDSDVSYYMNESDGDESEKDTINSQRDARSVLPKPVSIPYYKYLKRYKMTDDSKRELAEGNSRLKPPCAMFVDLSEANTETSAFYRCNSKTSFQGQNNSHISAWLQQQELLLRDTSNTNQPSDFDESQLENTMVVECPSQIKILLTPVFFKIVQDLVQSMDSQEWTIESILDCIQIDNVVKPLKLENLLCKSMKYMIGIPRVHLHLIQDVTLPDDFTSSYEEFPYARTRYDLSDTLLSTMDVVLDDLMVNIFLKKKTHSETPEEMAVVDSKVLLDFRQLRANLRFVGIGIFGISETRLKKLPLDFINYSDNEPVVLDLLYDRFHLEWLGNKKPNSLTVSLEDFSAIFLHEAVEIVFGAAASWLAFVNDMKSVLALFQKKRSKRVQYLVATISEYSARNTIGPDPAFLSRVSGVRRLGAKEVFVNDSWRLMTRIRHCSRSMTYDSLRRLKNSLRDHETEKWNLDSVFNTVINNFSKWRFWEFEKLDSCALLSNVFNRKPSGAIPGDLESHILKFLRSSENCLGLRVNRVSLCIYGGNEAEDNSMIVGPIQVDSETDYLENSTTACTVDEEKMYGQPSFVNIFLCTKIHQIDITLKPTVLTFVKHLLHVNRCFSPVFDTFSENSGSEMGEEQSIESDDGFDVARFMSKLRFSAHSMLFLDHINVTATVEHWVTQLKLGSIKLNGISHNLLVKSSHAATKATTKSTTLETPHIPIFADVSCSMDSLALVLQERIMTENHKQHTQLLSFDVYEIGINVAFDTSKTPRCKKLLEHGEPNYLNVFVKVRGLSLKVPQNLIKLYNFVEKWKTENLPNYDFLINRLIAEWESHKNKIPPKAQLGKVHHHKTAFKPLGLKLQFLFKQITFQSDVTPSLNFRYDILDFLGYVQSNSIEFDSKKQGFDLNYSVQILKQDVQFVTKHKALSQNENQFDLRQQIATFSIPAIRSEGRVETVNDRCKLDSIVIIDFIRLTLNANLIDQLLTTHTLLSSEFNDVIDVFLYSTRKIKEKRSKLNVLSANPSEASKNSLLFTNKISFRGLRIAAVSPVAVILFESDVLHGFVSNLKNLGHTKYEQTAAPLLWKIFANKFSISLNHNSGNIGDYMESAISRDDPSMLKYRMAFILMDLVIQNWNQEPKYEGIDRRNKSSTMESFFIKFLKLHAVMQPIALGKSADLYIYVNQELARRKEMKILQIRKLTQDTKRILRSLDVEVPKYKDKGRSFFEDKLVSVQINKLAIAIPLEKHEDITPSTTATSTPLAKPRSKPKHSIAFLFSVRFIDLSTRKLQRSHGLVNDLCLQFIPQFDESNEKFFSQIHHTKMNRVFLPAIKCNVYSQVSLAKHKVQIDAHVEGFEVDIEPTVVEYINNLDDIWQNNKLRFSSLTNENGTQNSQHRPSSTNQSAFSPKDVDESSALHMVSLELETSFNFSSGTCRFYPKMSKLIVPGRFPTKNASDNGTPIDLGIGVFMVPGLSLHSVFVTPIGEYARSVIDPSARRIYLEIMIHPSENIIYPSVIPFIKDILLGLKLGVQRSSEKKHVTKVENPSSVIQEFSVSLYLRLSQTRFDLSCQPASKVALSLLWKEGNFLMSSGNENGYQGITCTGSIKGASVVVQHAFSPEHCLLGETRNALFNMTIMSRNDNIAKDNSVSAVAHISEIRGDFNMRHFQDFLLFKNVWLDRSIDQFTAKDQTGHLSSSGEAHSYEEVESNEESEHPKPFSVFVVISLKYIDIAGDLGQAIGKVYLSTENITFKTTLVPGTIRSLTSTVGHTELKSEGRLKGSAALDGLQVVLNVKTLPAVIEDLGIHSWVNAQLVLGHIATTFEYEYQRILVAKIDPIVLDIKDRWNNGNSEETKVNIHLSVTLKEAEIISSIKTHPVFIGIGNKLILVIEEKRRLAFDSMASTYFVENNTKSKTCPPAKLPVRTTDPMKQRILIGKKAISPTGEISLTLERARLTLYPNRFSDNDFVQGKLEGLNIELNRIITLEEKINRSLVLKFATVMISKNRCKKLELQDENRLSIGEWIRHISESSSKNILYLPSTKMEMLTEQVFGSYVIEHQFSTEFVGRVDIALNFTLYKYLMELASLYKQLRSSSRKEKEKNHSAHTPKQKAVSMDKIDAANISDKTSDLNKASTQEPAASKGFIYKAIEPIRLNPQLKLMGDATPPLEWIGLQRQRVPEAIHDHVTSNLEDFLLIIQGLYAEQISKGAH